jgi:hypothetical protein
MRPEKATQRDFMRQLIEKHGRNEALVCKQYALAEQRGKVQRFSNSHGITPEEYAHALWRDGAKKGWF